MFFPVWIDECAPPHRQTLWMSLFFITEHLGIIIGYGLAYALRLEWHWGFLIQAATMALAGVLFTLVPKVYFDETSYKSAETAPL